MIESVEVAIIGCGRWGQNLIRVFNGLASANVILCCNKSNYDRLNKIKDRYPSIETTQNIGDVWTNPKIMAVVVATPDQTHFRIAREALEAGKHAFVEKPIALSLTEAKELVGLAEAKDKILMTGHIMQYHWVVRWIKERIETGHIHPLSILATRVEFGIGRADADLLWSSAIHDVSVIQYLLGKEPKEISVAEASINDEGMRDILFINLLFDDQVIAHIYAGFAGPYRERKLIIHTAEEIVVFDDLIGSLDLLSRIVSCSDTRSDKREYSKQFDGGHRVKIEDSQEPLLVECQHFLDCIKTNRTPLSGGRNSLAVIKTLDRIERALDGVRLAAKD